MAFGFDAAVFRLPLFPPLNPDVTEIPCERST